MKKTILFGTTLLFAVGVMAMSPGEEKATLSQKKACVSCKQEYKFSCKPCLRMGRKIRYCSKECQRKNWPLHKKECFYARENNQDPSSSAEQQPREEGKEHARVRLRLPGPNGELVEREVVVVVDPQQVKEEEGRSSALVRLPLANGDFIEQKFVLDPNQPRP